MLCSSGWSLSVWACLDVCRICYYKKNQPQQMVTQLILHCKGSSWNKCYLLSPQVVSSSCMQGALLVVLWMAIGNVYQITSKEAAVKRWKGVGGWTLVYALLQIDILNMTLQSNPSLCETLTALATGLWLMDEFSFQLSWDPSPWAALNISPKKTICSSWWAILVLNIPISM